MKNNKKMKEKYICNKFNVGAISIARNSIENNKKTIGEGIGSIQAITLISLVITIILLILLAGVAINLSLRENGIFNKVKQAKEQYTESIAKEKLEMVLLDVIAEKGTNSEYNNGQFLDDMLKANGIEVQGDNVIIDNYIFTLDRDSLGIVQSLGQTQIKVTKEVQKYLGKNANDKYEAQLLIIVESNTNLQKVEIINPDGTTFELETNQEKIAKDLTVEFDEEYKLEITDKTGKKETRTIVERTEEGIRTAEELAEFRDKVNTGLSYRGKIINLLKDIDLSSVCGENVNGKEVNWEPIGKYDEIYFGGTFDGNYHTIDNLYINSDKVGNALFMENSGTIKKLIVNNIYIYTKHNTEYFSAGIAIANYGNIENCETSGTIDAEVLDNGISYVGGIVGSNFGEIVNCCNTANLKSKSNKGYARVGGISGASYGSVTINNCYNTGTIVGNSNSSDVQAGGILGSLSYNTSTISNCYNVGNISGTGKNSYVAGIVGVNGENSTYPKGYITNSYYEENTAKCAYYDMRTTIKYDGMISETDLKKLTETLNQEQIDKPWVDDTNNINNGYPILKWQLKNKDKSVN